MAESSAFMIVAAKVDTTKKEDLKHYLMHAQPIFKAHGGKPVGRWAVAEAIVGEAEATHVIVMEFPSQAAIKAVFDDPDYVALLPSRSSAFPVLDIIIGETFEAASLLAG